MNQNTEELKSAVLYASAINTDKDRRGEFTNKLKIIAKYPESVIKEVAKCTYMFLHYHNASKENRTQFLIHRDFSEESWIRILAEKGLKFISDEISTVFKFPSFFMHKNKRINVCGSTAGCDKFEPEFLLAQIGLVGKPEMCTDLEEKKNPTDICWKLFFCGFRNDDIGIDSEGFSVPLENFFKRYPMARTYTQNLEPPNKPDPEQLYKIFKNAFPKSDGNTDHWHNNIWMNMENSKLKFQNIRFELMWEKIEEYDDEEDITADED